MSLSVNRPESKIFSSAVSSEPKSLIEAMHNYQLKAIAELIIDNQRLSFDQGLYLLDQAPLSCLQLLADYKRKQINGEAVLYATTLFVHPTNLCELSCPMCSFYAKPGWKSAWFSQPETIINQVRSHLSKGLNEIHIVGGLWREADLPYYQAIFQGIKALDPKLHIKALTPVEYDFLAQIHQIDVQEVLERMISWGLGSLPGGGAEILVEAVRKQVAPQKISSDRYLEIHQIAHHLGLLSNITMLYGHVEESQDIIVHLDKIRTLQDQTQGFRTFVPLKYHIENNALGKRIGRLKPKNAKRVYAVSRLMLDNMAHIKVLWNYLGIEEALDLLNYGADDLGSTALEEKIIKMAGGVDYSMSQEGIKNLILRVGRHPKRCHSGEI
jgi:aminodeoxyfutalosine synthase